MRIGLWGWGMVLGLGLTGGCTEANPFLMETEGSGSADTGSSTSATAGSTMSSTTNSDTDPPTTTTATSVVTSTTDPDPDTDPTEDTTGSDETDVAPGCDGGRVCVADPPGEWQGPVIWGDSPHDDGSLACPAAYPNLQLGGEVFDELDAPPAECECSCGDASGVTCGEVTLEYHGEDSNCGSPDQMFVMAPLNCTAAPSGAPGHHWQVPAPGVDGGSCPPSLSETIPVSTWTSTTTLCGGGSSIPDVCDPGQQCVPGPAEEFESRVCIWQEGSIDCPRGIGYDDRFVRHQAIADTRACAACTCESPTGDCTGSVQLWNPTSCSAAPTASVSLGGSCTATGNLAQNAVEGARLGTTFIQNTECEPSEGTAVGEAEPSEPITLCCLDA